MDHKIFVFGSNEAGRHGKGAAWYAEQHEGAIYGQGFVLQEQSYAIPTKDHNLRTLPLTRIEEYVKLFIEFANMRPDLEFQVTSIGCGLAGYTPTDIAPFFRKVPSNVFLSKDFLEVLNGQ